MADYTNEELTGFIHESNQIEGILREPREDELAASRAFLGLEGIAVEDVEIIVSVMQPDARLRDKPGLNVYVGEHIPPPGGPDIEEELSEILHEAGFNGMDPYLLHHKYETLHPFTDGNGRSGRLLWAWQMLKFDYAPGLKLGFLHAWYYQSLQHNH